MNYKAVLYYLGKMFLILGALMFLPLLVCIYYKLQSNPEANYSAFLIPIIVLTVIGAAFSLIKPKNVNIFAREGFVICGLAWVLFSAFGSLPFILSGSIPNFVDAFFETASGFTTTGSSILTEIESLPKSILFWRSFTHWIGGMGILSFMLAILPRAKGNALFIMRAEVPGPTTGKVVSKIADSARILYVIYFVMTLAEIFILFFGTRLTGDNMRFYDCVVNSFATAGTGGFSVLNKSIAGYNSSFAEIVITIFMFLFGVNFNLYFFLLMRKFSTVFKDEELRGYIIVNLTGVILIIINILPLYNNVFYAVKDAFFSVNSVMSTTGFCTADFNTWPTFSKGVLLILMCIGCSAGSTGGGLKIIRLELLAKQITRDFKQLLRPNSVVNIRINNKPVDGHILKGVNSYLNAYIITLVVSFLLLTIDNYDIITSLSAVIACFNNIGPGLELVGPVGNFAHFSAFSKIVLIFDMLAGRLELFPMLLLASRSTWRKAK